MKGVSSIPAFQAHGAHQVETEEWSFQSGAGGLASAGVPITFEPDSPGDAAAPPI